MLKIVSKLPELNQTNQMKGAIPIDYENCMNSFINVFKSHILIVPLTFSHSFLQTSAIAVPSI